MRKITPALTIATFGEILWDILPRGIFLGGAPFNVAYHLHTHGIHALPISAVGHDFLGNEALLRITQQKIDARFIPTLNDRPTGSVRATLNAAGSASYVFAKNTAWDHVPVTRELLNEPAPAALVFGTLALRNSANRRALATLCSTWKTTLRVLDLNLRPPFDQPAAISFAIKLAQVIKLNDEELSRLTHLPVRTERQLKAATLALAKQLSCARLCVTAGARGAALLWDGSWHWENGRKIVVRDTVGAGDSFLGSLLTSLIAQHASPAAALARAARLGEFIASRDGATPPYRINAQGLPVDA